jgi:D-glycero-beta-D-manno-heptose 1-phosphate adenylyltransferase
MRTAVPSTTSFVQEKIFPADHVAKKVSAFKKAGKTVATLNGSFDLLHAGHLYILFEAARQADILIVALNSDASIKRYKSKDRPIIPLNHRLEMVAALGCVDFVTWFEEDDPRNLIRLIQPNVHVNGAEYGENCIEAESLRECGATLHLVDRIPLLATSDIIKKIKTLCD